MESTSCRRGAAMVFIVIVLLMLIGFIGLAIDWGYTFRTSQQLQTAADAAALAGAEKLFTTHAGARSASGQHASPATGSGTGADRTSARPGGCSGGGTACVGKGRVALQRCRLPAKPQTGLPRHQQALGRAGTGHSPRIDWA